MSQWVHPKFAKIPECDRQQATLEGIEKAVRQQMMEHVSPKIALFLCKK
jgi:hypothetical protein